MTEIICSIRPLAAVLVSAAAALLVLLTGSRVRPNVREGITFAAAGIKFLLVYSMVPAVLEGKIIVLRVMRLTDRVDLMFRVDPAGMIFACIASFLWILTSVYSIGYMRGHGEKHQTGYYAAFAMCLCGTMGICFAGNLLTFFLFFEVLTIATYPLVVHHRDGKSRASGRKYLFYTLTSGQLLFAGIVYVYFRCGTMDFQAGGFLAPHVSGSTAAILFFLMIGAGAVKAGVMPLHSWLPAAMVAPTPVSALLHAVAVVNAGAFALLRVVCYTFGPELSRQCGGATVMVWLAAGTIILSSLIALQKTNLKARLAYSTVGQLSYLVLGICLLSPYSVQGALYHMVAHSFLKITLFMCAGAIMVTTHKTDIREMWGIGRRMPYTMAAFLTASLGIAGLPFLPAFLSKANLILGAAKEGKPVLIAVLAASALLSLTYLVPVGYLAFSSRRTEPEFASGPVRIPMGKRGRGVFFADASPCLLAPLLITVGISFALGIAPDFGPRMMQMARMAAGSIFS